MNEQIVLKRNKTACGRVRLEYRNEHTGRVTERVEADNHVFMDMFHASGWLDTLMNRRYPTLWLMSGNSPTDPRFPLLTGKVVGWGAPLYDTAAENNAYKGTWVGSSADIARISADGISFRYKYYWTPEQVLEPVGSLGISEQFLSSGSATTYSYRYDNPLKASPAPPFYGYYNDAIGGAVFSIPTPSHNGLIWQNGKGYHYLNNQIEILDPLDVSGGFKTSVKVPDSVTGDVSFGLDSDGRVYLLAYANGAASMYKYSDITLSELIGVYPCNSLIDNYYNSGMSFVVYQGDVYRMFPNNTPLRKCNYLNNEPFTESEISVRDYFPNAANTGAISPPCYALDGKYLFIMKNYGMSSPGYSNGTELVWDLEKSEPAAVYNEDCSGTSYQSVFMRNPFAQCGAFMVGKPPNSWWGYKNALTRFVIPDGAAARQTGDSIFLDYEIEVRI
ncbi:hypothetical protein FACS1894188_10930 [Clostridia bacterium]|nr:hypothetical protein FACS1894188_10930 [Clostridia bacterium]